MLIAILRTLYEVSTDNANEYKNAFVFWFIWQNCLMNAMIFVTITYVLYKYFGLITLSRFHLIFFQCNWKRLSSLIRVGRVQMHQIYGNGAASLNVRQQSHTLSAKIKSLWKNQYFVVRANIDSNHIILSA